MNQAKMKTIYKSTKQKRNQATKTGQLASKNLCNNELGTTLVCKFKKKTSHPPGVYMLANRVNP